MRVGLALTATGVASIALDREALAGANDTKTLAAIVLFVVLVLGAGLRRPPTVATHIAFASLAAMLVLASFDLGTTAAMLEYVALALAAAYYAAEHLRPLVVGAFALWTPALWLLGGPSLSPLVWIASLVALGLAAYALLDPRRVHPSDRLRRAGYAILAIAIVSASAARTLGMSAGADIVDAMTLVIAVALPLLAYVRMPTALREPIAMALAFVAFAAIGATYIAALGLSPLRGVVLLEILVVAGIATRSLRPAWRAPALATVLGNELVMRDTLILGTDAAWAVVAVVLWVAVVRRIVSRRLAAWNAPVRPAGAPLGWLLLPLAIAWRTTLGYLGFAPLLTLVGDDELANDV